MKGTAIKAALVLLCLVTVQIAVGQDIVTMLRMVKPAVVTVIPQNTFGLDGGHGTGFFISRTHLLTNYHVVKHASSVKLRFNNGAETVALHFVAQDTTADIAILEVATPDSIAFTPLPFAKGSPEQGERVYVVGNPLEYEQSVSDGIVASIRPLKHYGRMLQFTAAISSGNSGSPLLNGMGQVLGMASLYIKSGQNLNFAVPADRIQELKLTDIVAFRPSQKEYEGVMMHVRDAFEVDTTLIGRPPSNLTVKEVNHWRIRTSGIRFRWSEDAIDKNMNRLMRGVKRNFPRVNIETDTITMLQARTVVGEMLGYNKEDISYPEETQSKIAAIHLALGYVASRFEETAASVEAMVAGTIGSRGQFWQEFEKGKAYMVFAVSDTAAVQDLDFAVFRQVDGQWIPIASDTDDDARPTAYFEAVETEELAVVFRTARRTSPSVEGAFGCMVVGFPKP